MNGDGAGDGKGEMKNPKEGQRLWSLLVLRDPDCLTCLLGHPNLPSPSLSLNFNPAEDKEIE